MRIKVSLKAVSGTSIPIEYNYNMYLGIRKLLFNFLSMKKPKLAGKYKMHMVGYKANKDLKYLVELVEGGKLKPVIDKCYPIEETAEAFRYFGDGCFKGKIVVTF